MIDADKGQEGARTPRVAEEFGQLEQLARAMEQAVPEPLLPGLDGPPAPETLDLVGRAAEQLNAQRRARGRPAGTQNKRNSEVFDYLEARGFKQPELHMAEIISADPVQLSAALAMSTTYGPVGVPPTWLVLEIMKLQAKCAADLLPYKFAKRHEAKVMHEHKLGIMIGGTLSTQQTEALLAQGQMVDITGYSDTTEDSAAQ